MNFVYGDDWPVTRNDKERKKLRREAVNRLIAHKERLERREQKEQGTVLVRKMSLESVSSGPNVDSILASRMAGNAMDKEYKMTDREKYKAKGITDYLRHKRQQTRRLHIQEERRAYGFTIYRSNWSLLLKPKNKFRIHLIYVAQHKAELRLQFRRVINLVFACNRFLNILAEISGNTSKIVAEVREFTGQSVEPKKEVNDPNVKFIFDPNSFKLSTDTPVPRSVLFTLTKPWFARTPGEVDTAVTSLQVLRCFAELPTNTQRIVASIAWFINIPEDKVLIRQSHIAQDYYIILSGRISRTMLVGAADGQSEQTIFRHLNTFSKDTIFGEEAITRPGSEREYSATSCTKCDLLSINIHDYFACIMTPCDPRALYPDHIKFLCTCDFLRSFPRERMLTDAEGNISLAYFRPNCVVETNMEEAEWVYVVWWGTCRTLCEIDPTGKVRVKKKKLSWIPKDDEMVLMENRMTEPVRQSVYISEKDSPGSVEGIFLEKRQNFVNKSILQEIENNKKKSHQSLKLYNEQEMENIAMKRSQISNMLSAKRKQDLRRRRENTISDINNKDFVTLPTIKNNKNSLVSNVTAGTPKVLTFTLEDQTMHQDDDSSDSDNDQRSKGSKGRKMPNSIPKIAGANFDFEKLLTKAKARKDSVSRASENSTFLENADRTIRTHWDKLDEELECQPTEEDRTKPFKKSVQYQQGSTSSGGSNVSGAFDCMVQRRPCKSGWSKEKALDDQKVDKVRSSRAFSLRTHYYGKSAEDISGWKLKKTLIKGDETGFEWVNLKDGKFRPGPEIPIFVSDGCELIMIRKSFLIDIMGCNGQRSRLVVN